jgi:hypothetical protein
VAAAVAGSRGPALPGSAVCRRGALARHSCSYRSCLSSKSSSSSSSGARGTAVAAAARLALGPDLTTAVLRQGPSNHAAL